MGGGGPLSFGVRLMEPSLALRFGDCVCFLFLFFGPSKLSVYLGFLSGGEVEEMAPAYEAPFCDSGSDSISLCGAVRLKIGSSYYYHHRQNV